MKGGSAASYGREDGQLGAVCDGGLQAVKEADVLAAQVDVYEASQAAVLVGDAGAQLAEALEQAVEHLLHSCAFELGLACALSGGAQLSGDLHGHRHRSAPCAVACEGRTPPGRLEVDLHVGFELLYAGRDHVGVESVPHR